MTSYNKIQITIYTKNLMIVVYWYYKNLLQLATESGSDIATSIAYYDSLTVTCTYNVSTIMRWI